MRRLAPLAAVVLLVANGGAAAAQDRLPALAADPRELTASGVSSGGYMAVQLHVAHARSVRGVGVLAAGPYFCAQGSVATAYYNCMTPSRWTPLPSVEALRAHAAGFARAGLIDPLESLASARVWLFSGTNDRTVDAAVVEAARRFYTLAGVTPGAVALIGDRPAGHGMVTERDGSACALTAPPFIVDCDFDAAGELLAHLLGRLEPAAPREFGRIVRFDQREHAGGDAYAISMADAGYLYLPRGCEAGGCRIHVVFHGCRQSAEAIGERFVRGAGYNRWADSNRLLVLYPQTIARNGWGVAGGRWSFVFNPRGCWDWWGYTGAQYATRLAPQIRAVKSMVDRLAAPR
jgi:poly(3-hydroxybutyrate) depolymerase